MLPLKEYIKHPVGILTALLIKLNAFFPDKLYLRLLFRLKMGYWPDLKHPKTFNEKLQWLKLYNRRPEYTQMVDKYAVKEYVAKIIGKEYVIPTLGVWERPEDIEWDALPDQFVLKTTHGGGGSGVVICSDKSSFNREDAIRKLNESLKKDIYKTLREWPYKNVHKRIIAEQYLSNDGAPLEDYKVHNFNGVPRFILLCRDRFKDSGLTEDFYSDKWEHLDVTRPGHETPGGHEKPKELAEMLSIAERLSKDIPFVRTDFYTVENRVFFGELTFFPAGGMKKFEPERYDTVFGSWLKLELGGGKYLISKGSMCLVILPGQQELYDYKLFCFNGHVQLFKIDFGRFVDHHANYYDRNANLLPFGEKKYRPVPDKKLAMPVTLPQMLEMADQLSKGHPFMRIDFYENCGRPYFGEITFFPAGGMGQFIPQQWDGVLGDYLNLQELK